MEVGIEKIDLYAGRFSADARELARARGRDPERITRQVMLEARSVVPPWEDAVTLAVNATRRVLAAEDRPDIELLIVATESGVDFGKPISTWLHRYCELAPNCRNFELKHACYGATAALKLAATWVASGVRPGKKALVVSTDLTRPNQRDGYDFAGGGCAVAMLVSAAPRILNVNLERAGYWTNEVADTFRPTVREEIADNQLSLYSYLDALEGACDHFEEVVGQNDYEAAFKKHIYHAPFPGMALQAHRTVLTRNGPRAPEEVLDSFERKVRGGLHFAHRIGSAYGASNFVSLLGLLQASDDLAPGDPISLFAYGSGCQAELWCGTVGAEAVERVRALALDQLVDARRPLTLNEYGQSEAARAMTIDCANFEPDRDVLEGAYADLYQGRGYLVLERVAEYRRQYGWS